MNITKAAHSAILALGIGIGISLGTAWQANANPKQQPNILTAPAVQAAQKNDDTQRTK